MRRCVDSGAFAYFQLGYRLLCTLTELNQW